MLCISDNPSNLFLYQQNQVSFSPASWSNITCTFNNKKASDKTPVLIVPGILGTEIMKDNNFLWIDPVRMTFSPSDSFMDPMQFLNNLNPSDNQVLINNVIKSVKSNIAGIDVVIFDYTESLIQEFIGQGYVEGETLFTFPYDWRYGVSGKFSDPSNSSGQVTNVDLLKNKIDAIITQTGAEKIDVVAHSNGGLITKKYVMDNFANHKINKAVFVGVPNIGAPKAIKALLQGDDYGIKVGSVGLLSEKEMKKISENMPVAYDLLPTQKYYSVSGSFVKTIENPTIFDSSWQVIEKDLNYQEFESYMINEKGLNQQAFNNSEALHTQVFDDYDLRTTGVDLYNIVGCKSATLTNITQVKNVGNPDVAYKQLGYNTGDGTVPIQSATNLPINQENKYYAISPEHGKMPSQDGIRQQIVNLIAGSNLFVSKDSLGKDIVTQDVNKCQLNGKAIEVFSPVDIFIIDQNGNRLGLNGNGDIINEIAEANFEIWGEPASTQGWHKFIFLPTDNGQTYTVNMQGTGIGTYTINVKDIQNTTENKTESFINLPVTSELTGTVNLGEVGSRTTLTVKETPSSQAVVIYPGDYTPDTIAPEAIIEFDPVKKDLKFVGKDNLSLASEITVTDKDDTITLTDKAGNITEIKLKDKNRKITMKAEIKSIKYNGKLADTSKNKMAFLWLFDKKGKLTMLSQYVSSTLRHGSGQANDYNVLAVYGGKNTTFVGKDISGKILKTEKGLKILKITTDKVDLGWSY
jgi:triacylglycerol esterase/lipase EstA (alpha/beta hydrolase family)